MDKTRFLGNRSERSINMTERTNLDFKTGSISDANEATEALFGDIGENMSIIETGISGTTHERYAGKIVGTLMGVAWAFGRTRTKVTDKIGSASRSSGRYFVEPINDYALKDNFGVYDNAELPDALRIKNNELDDPGKVRYFRESWDEATIFGQINDALNSDGTVKNQTALDEIMNADFKNPVDKAIQDKIKKAFNQDGTVKNSAVLKEVAYWPECRDYALKHTTTDGKLRFSNGTVVNNSKKAKRPKLKTVKPTNRLWGAAKIFGGFAGGTVVDTVSAERMDFTPELGENDNLELGDSNIGVVETFRNVMNNYGAALKDNPDALKALATEVHGLLEDGYMELVGVSDSEEMFPTFVRLCMEKGSLSAVLKASKEERERLGISEDYYTYMNGYKTAWQNILTKMKSKSPEVWDLLWTNESAVGEMAQDVSDVMVDAAFYDLLIRVRDTINKSKDNSQTNVQNVSEPGNFMASYGQKVLEMSEDKGVLYSQNDRIS